jgi:hypothetical protein
MKTRKDKSLREIGVAMLGQGSIVVALTPHLNRAVEDGDQELHDILDREIDRAQVRVRKLAALVPVSRKHLAKHLLGFRNGIKMPRRARRKRSASATTAPR